MSTPEIQKANIGTRFLVTVVDQAGAIVPLQGATMKKILLEKPKSTGNPRTVLEKNASFPAGEDGSQARLQYVTVDGDLDTLGEWLIQAYVEEGPNTKFHTSKEPFMVVRNVGERL